MPAIGHHTALYDYLAMGPDRSLAKLHRHYLATASEKRPCLRTLATWSKLYSWSAAAADHEEFCGAALRSRLRETALQQQFDRVTALSNVAEACLSTAAETLRSATVTTASEIKSLVTAAIDALKMIELLTGGVSERREECSGGIAAEALALLRAIEEEKRASARTVVPGPENALG